IALEKAAAGGDERNAREPGQLLVPVERLLHQERHPALHPGEDGPLFPSLEGQREKAVLAHRPAGHLPRLVLVGRGLGGGGQVHAESRSSGSKRTLSRMSCTTAWMPSPVLQLVKTNGFPLRISRES